MKKITAVKVIKYVVLGIAIALNIFILVNGFIPGNASGEMSGNAAENFIKVYNTLVPDGIPEAAKPVFKSNFRKIFGHFGLFGLDAIFTTTAFYLFLKDIEALPKWSIIICSALFGFIIAVLSELAQIITDGRSGSMRDVAIDSIGYLLGLLTVMIVIIIVEFNIKTAQKKQAE